MDYSQTVEDYSSANVTTIFKRGSRKLPSNYRPISQTSAICKIFESLIHNYLFYYYIANLYIEVHRPMAFTSLLISLLMHIWLFLSVGDYD